MNIVNQPINLALRILYKIFGRSKIYRFLGFEPAENQVCFKTTTENLFKINFGCGENPIIGWINIDARELDGVDIVGGIDALTQFQDKTIGVLYASHVVEHLCPTEASKFFSLCRRKISESGALILSVPDFDYIVDQYLACDRDIKSIESMLMGGRDYAENFHLSVYNFDSLRSTLTAHGFSKIGRCSGFGELLDVDDWSKEVSFLNGRWREISLNVIATN
jgi:hypothetical protein